MNHIKYLDTPSLFLGEKERLSARKALQREGQRENHALLHSPLKGRVYLGILGMLVALVVLVACPAGGGRGALSCAPHIFVLEGTTCRPLVEVGEAVRIGMVSEFGVGEDSPTDLAAIGNTLYMVGLATDALYTLNIDPTDDIDDGSADRVGRVIDFGVNEDFPTGLAAIDGTLYMVGQTNIALYTLNIDPDDGIADGSADRVGRVIDFGVGEGGPTGLAAIGSTLYMVGTANDALYTLDITTGIATRVGNVAGGFGVREVGSAGLAAVGTTLYMVGVDNNVLYTLNIDPDDMTPDGMAIQVGMANRFGTSDSPGGLATIGSTLYMAGAINNALYALRYQ